MGVVQHVLQIDAMVECAAKRSAIAHLEPWIRFLQRLPGQVASDSDSEENDGEGTPGDEKDIIWTTKKGQLHFSTAIFPSYRGYAVFPRLSLANHSCQPSCAVEFTFSATVFLLAQEGSRIQPDHELTISYLDASLGAKVSSTAEATARRRQLLRPYGFDCNCTACCSSGQMATEQVVKQTAQTGTQKVRKVRKRKAVELDEEAQADHQEAASKAKRPKKIKKKPISPTTFVESTCLACDGTGQMLMEVCPLCEGKGRAS